MKKWKTRRKVSEQIIKSFLEEKKAAMHEKTKFYEN